MAAAEVLQMGQDTVPAVRRRGGHRVVAWQKQLRQGQHIGVRVARQRQRGLDRGKPRREIPGGRRCLIERNPHQLRSRVQIWS